MNPESPAPQRPTSPHTDAWAWIATYADGTTLAERDPAGQDVHAMADVIVPQVVQFTLLPCRPGLPALSVPLDYAQGQRLVFFRRRSIELSLASGQEVAPRRTLHALGYQQLFGDQPPVAHVTYWQEDGTPWLAPEESAESSDSQGGCSHATG